MGMQLGIKREAFSPNENQEWLGSAHGTSEADSITLDSVLTRAAFGTLGYVPSGVVLGKVTATGRYAPYDGGASDGTETAAGLLFTTVNLGDPTRPETGDISAALYWHGEVRVSKLPTDNGLDSGARADMPHIRFVD